MSGSAGSWATEHNVQFVPAEVKGFHVGGICTTSMRASV
jgi:hypothetical protein